MSVPAKSAPAHRLADVPLFAGLVDSALDQLARESRVRRYAAGQVLWNEGDQGDALLLLERASSTSAGCTATSVEVVLSVVEPPSRTRRASLARAGSPGCLRRRRSDRRHVRLPPLVLLWPSCAASQRSWKELLRTLAPSSAAAAGNVRHVGDGAGSTCRSPRRWLLARAREQPRAMPGRREVTIGRRPGRVGRQVRHHRARP